MRAVPLLLAGCGPSMAVEAPSYAVHIAPLMEEHCVRCHTSRGRWDGGVELDLYESASSNAVRSACTALDPEVADRYGDLLVSALAGPGEAACSRWETTSMPPGAIEHWSLDEQETFANWIATGMQP